MHINSTNVSVPMSDGTSAREQGTDNSDDDDTGTSNSGNSDGDNINTEEQDTTNNNEHGPNDCAAQTITPSSTNSVCICTTLNVIIYFQTAPTQTHPDLVIIDPLYALCPMDTSLAYKFFQCPHPATFIWIH